MGDLNRPISLSLLWSAVIFTKNLVEPSTHMNYHSMLRDQLEIFNSQTGKYHQIGFFMCIERVLYVRLRDIESKLLNPSLLWLLSGLEKVHKYPRLNRPNRNTEIEVRPHFKNRSVFCVNICSIC